MNNVLMLVFFWTLGLEMIPEYKLPLRQLHCSRNYLIIDEGIGNMGAISVCLLYFIAFTHKFVFRNLCKVGFVMGSLLMMCDGNML